MSVRDGEGTVTTARNVALSITVALLVVLGLTAIPLPAGLRLDLQGYALVAQALHALGHLAGWYDTYRWFDDALHALLMLPAAVLALRLAQAWNVLPARHTTRLRAAIVALVASLALAGAWEIFEFTMDNVQGTREQDDLTDTMLDMMDGALGGVLAAGYAVHPPVPSAFRGRNDAGASAAE